MSNRDAEVVYRRRDAYYVVLGYTSLKFSRRWPISEIVRATAPSGTQFLTVYFENGYVLNIAPEMFGPRRADMHFGVAIHTRGPRKADLECVEGGDINQVSFCTHNDVAQYVENIGNL